MVPSSLRVAFKIHFVTDMIFAVPLFLFPVQFMDLFGFSNIEPVTARLVAAALFGIGGISFLTRHQSREVFLSLLKLKIIWSFMAIFGLFISFFQGAPKSVLLFLIIFILFFITWMFFLLRLRRQGEVS